MALPPVIQRHADNLQRCIPKFQAVLPPHLSAQKLNQTVINALMANRYLANADAASVMQSAMTAAVLGLEVDGVTGQGYITPFKGKAQFIPGYKGYITLAQNAGFMVSGDVVREKDEFFYKRGLEPVLDHSPRMGSPTERGPVLYAYATARSNTLPSDFSVVHVEEVNKIRDNSEAYKAYMAGKIKSTPWANNYDKMAIKTAIRSLASRLPLNVQKAHALESAYETGKHAHINEEGNLDIIEHEPQTSMQPSAQDLGLEQYNCEHCKDTGLMPDLVGGTQTCIHCVK